MRQRYYYICDGGNNPAHHHAKGVDINHNLDTGRVTIELGNNPKDRFNSVQEAEEALKERYEYVRLEFVQSTSTKEIKTILKNEQPFTYKKRII